MRSSHDEARADRGTAVELVLTGRRLPRFALLLAAMLAELTLAPFIDMLPRGLALVQALTTMVLLAALAVAGSRRLAVLLFAGALLVHLAASLFTGSVLTAAAHALRLVFLCYVVGLVFRRVLADRAVTLDTVAGAACAYMLLGLVWGDLFMLLESWRPGSFHMPATWTQGSDRTLRSSLVYFSFATLTTVGYGEIHPNDPAAGSLCAAEALVGQLYLTIMIARLVGLHTSRAASDRGRPGAES
jgi:multisubunit Na+/H+ antiporter MnhF subunit